MFTINQIHEAQAKIKLATDFPQFVQDIIQIGVIGFETFVSDSHSVYYGQDGFVIASPAIYPSLDIANECDHAQFLADLKAHQGGETDYFTFCKDCAKTGVEKWKVDMGELTCTYFDTAGKEVLVETIPVP